MKNRAIQVVDNTNDGRVMDVKIDPQRDNFGKIVKGVVIGKTLEQNKAFILLGHPGDFKTNLTIGIGIEDILLGTDLLEYRHRIREQFAKDGLKTTELDLYDINNIKIEAHYENS